MIQRLDQQTIGKIAAGEVVERPAAVVKELIENAIDAGATRIDIEISGGGIGEVSVRDDGAGIPADELELAVERHSTSKLQTIDDLERMRSLGFRGEALASIAAVSDLTIQSIASNATAGASLRVRHGNVSASEPSAWGIGTAITVRDLFASVPARRRFLRAAATETSYITRLVSAYALAYPSIAISLAADGRSTLRTDGTGDRLAAAVGVWGHDTAQHLVHLVSPEHEHEGYSVEGVVSLPSLDRARRDRQFIFAQGRLISSRQLSTAFEQAYHTLLMIGRHPICCLLISAPPERIDVNVHPTKAEVRFADERLVFALVQRATRATLLANAADQPIPTVYESPLHRPQTVGSQSDAPSIQRIMSLADPLRSATATPPGEASWPEEDGGTTAAEDRHERKLPVLRVLGQIAASFITAEGPDGLYLIDQHAAHERIQFEKIMAGYASRSPSRQQLLEPVVVDLTGEQMATLEASQDELAGLGFDLDNFGPGAVAIRGVPVILAKRNPAESLTTVLDELQEGGRGDSRLESLAISAACHGSIRAGQPLSLLEMRELVADLERCSSSLACGHGRPTIIKMTAEELARQFSRR